MCITIKIQKIIKNIYLGHMLYSIPSFGDWWENQLTYKESSNFYLQHYHNIMIIEQKTSPEILKVIWNHFIDVLTLHKVFIRFHKKRVYIVHKLTQLSTSLV
jgi:hypothetical protein